MPSRNCLISILLFLTLSTSAFAQWRTESFDLVAGWQAIYLRVDPGDTQIGELLQTYPQIEEIWRWRPQALDARIVSSPEQPVTGSEWQLWKRNNLASSTFFYLRPNDAYLVRVAEGSSPFTLDIHGAVGVPEIRWRVDGLNLLGFPINSLKPVQIDAYFGPSEIEEQTTEIYAYKGGPLSDINPARLTVRFATVERGKAYWIRSNKYSDYDGPLRVRSALGEGLDFGASRSTVQLVLTNRSPVDMDTLLEPVSSEPAPGETSPPPAVPLTFRTKNAEGAEIYVPFGRDRIISLRPGETIGITVGMDRSRLSGNRGDLAASLLRVTDNKDLSEFYLPVRAEVADLTGLWIGVAQITHVQNQLQRFQKEEDNNADDADGNTDDSDEPYRVDADGKYIPVYLTDASGNPILDGEGNPVPETDYGLNQTAQTFPLTLILHINQAGEVRLLSEIYQGVTAVGDDELPIVGLTTDESDLLTEYLDLASRASAVHLPQSVNVSLSGSIAPGATAQGELDLPHSSTKNPFVHLYHPDHDNLDPRFEQPLPEGIETFNIRRNFAISVFSAPQEGDGPSWGTTVLTGTYAETLRGLHKNPIATEGVFALRKVSSIPTVQGLD